jgi:acyl carrier protein
MTKKQFFQLLDELLELEPNTIHAGQKLAELPKWDSLAIIGLIALLDEHFGISVPAVKINECRTVDDVAALAGDRIQP